MTYLWRYRITDRHRTGVTERLESDSRRPRHRGRSSPRRTSAKNGVTTAKKPLPRRHIRHRLRMPGTLSQHDHRDVQTLSMNCNCGDLRSFCTVAANRRRRFSQRAATVRSRLSSPRRHLRTCMTRTTRTIDHHIDEKTRESLWFSEQPP